MLHEEGLDELVCELLHLEAPPPDLTNWRKFVERVVNPKKQVKIAVVGKYIDLQDAYKSIYESLTHAAASQDCGIDLKLIDAESLEDGVDGQLQRCRRRSHPRRIWRARRGRKNPRGAVSPAKTKSLISVSVSACRSRRLNLRAMFAESTEPTAPSSIKNAPSRSSACWKNSARSKTKARACGSAPGRPKSRRARSRKKFTEHDEVLERHRHRYEFNMKYRDQMDGERISPSRGTSPDGSLAELIELQDHPYFLACQYHPEFQSKPNKPHPLFKGFIQACLAHEAN